MREVYLPAGDDVGGGSVLAYHFGIAGHGQWGRARGAVEDGEQLSLIHI